MAPWAESLSPEGTGPDGLTCGGCSYRSNPPQPPPTDQPRTARRPFPGPEAPPERLSDMAFQRQEHHLEEWEIELIQYRIHSGWSPGDVSRAMGVPLTTIRAVINPVQKGTARKYPEAASAQKPMSKAHEIAANLGIEIEKE